MYLGLACEGVSDHAVIENIIVGLLDDFDVDTLKPLQPHIDETTRKQSGFGGWTTLFDYLITDRFEEDLINSFSMIIHFDSDISQIQGFDVLHQDRENNPLEPEVLVEKIKARIIALINTKRANLYAEYENKIIFCISVHSIECWILPFYVESSKKHKIINCERALQHQLQPRSLVKSFDFYLELSGKLAERRNVKILRKRDRSFDIFCRQLENFTS